MSQAVDDIVAEIQKSNRGRVSIRHLQQSIGASMLSVQSVQRFILEGVADDRLAVIRTAAGGIAIAAKT